MDREPDNGQEREPDLPIYARRALEESRPRRRAIRSAGLVLLGALLIGIPGFLILGGDDAAELPPEEPSPTPVPPGPVEPPPPPQPRPGIYRVATEQICLNFREGPSRDAPATRCLEPGTEVRWDGEREEADDEVWYRLTVVADGGQGWAASRFLEPAAPEEPDDQSEADQSEADQSEADQSEAVQSEAVQSAR